MEKFELKRIIKEEIQRILLEKRRPTFEEKLQEIDNGLEQLRIDAENIMEMMRNGR